MKKYVADTHALLWYLTDSSSLGSVASRVFDEGAKGEALIFVPAIVLAELYFANEKLHRPLSFNDEFARLAGAGQFVLVPFQPEDVLDFDTDAAAREMHDRMIVGCARRLGAACLSCDSVITSSGLVETVW